MVKKRITIYAPYPKEIGPSQRFRFEQYLSFLEGNFEINYQTFYTKKTWDILHKPGNFLKKTIGILGSYLHVWIHLWKTRRAEYVFVHREISPIGPPLFEWIIVHLFNRKMIFDYDDAIWIPNSSDHNKLFVHLKNNKKVHNLISWSNKVVAGNDYLADFGRQLNNNVVLIPTTIDTVNHHNPDLYPKKIQQQLTIGWTGTLTTSKYIKEVGIDKVLKRLEDEYNTRFLFISNEYVDFGLKNMDYIHWSADTEIEDLLKMDIGIMPLSDDKWAKGKCGFKAIQYMALEIVPIVSPVGVNVIIVDHMKNGLVCNSQEEWYVAIKKLIENPELRMEMGVKARKKIEQHYSVKANKEKFLKLFS